VTTWPAQIETFGRYGFNKSHSVDVLRPELPDGVGSRPTTRRVHGGAAVVGDREHRQVVQYINEARELDLEVLAPDVNEGDSSSPSWGERRIRFGLGAIRNVGWGAIDPSSAGRQDAPFTTLAEFVERIDPPAMQLSGCSIAHRGRRAATGWAATGAALRGPDGVLGEAQLLQQEKEGGQGRCLGS